MEEQSQDITLRVAKLTTVFCSLAVVIYAATHAEPSPPAVWFLKSGPLLAVIIWLQKRRTTNRRRSSRLGLLSRDCVACRDPLVCIQDARAFRVAADGGTVRSIGAAYISGFVAASLAWYFQMGK
jgi:hypothetical protein